MPDAIPLNDLLRYLDQAAANLERLENVWRQAEPEIPSSAMLVTTSAYYEDLCRTWDELLTGLPPIDGWTITTKLPDPGQIGRWYVDLLEIEPFGGDAQGPDTERTQPERDIAEYRWRLGRARRKAVRQRLTEVIAVVDEALALIAPTVSRDADDPREDIQTPEANRVRGAVVEIDRLVGGSMPGSRWGDLHRHLRFSQPHDWVDIIEADWPDVKAGILVSLYSPDEPLEIPAGIDLGAAASNDPSGSASTQLDWAALNSGDFERLLFDLLRALPEFQNVLHLTKENAPDRGRDLSAERHLSAGANTVRVERVIIQCKHYLTKSVRDVDVDQAITQAGHWTPPVVETVIIATSGDFTTDAVATIERHNGKGVLPRVEPWNKTQLEALLASQPTLAAGYGLL